MGTTPSHVNAKAGVKLKSPMSAWKNYLHYMSLAGLFLLIALWFFSLFELANICVFEDVLVYLWLWAASAIFAVLWLILNVVFRISDYDLHSRHFLEVESHFWGHFFISSVGLALFWNFHNQWDWSVTTTSGPLNIVDNFRHIVAGPTSVYELYSTSTTTRMMMALSNWFSINAVLVATGPLLIYLAFSALVTHHNRIFDATNVSGGTKGPIYEKRRKRKAID